jgi:hypothetical protein
VAAMAVLLALLLAMLDQLVLLIQVVVAVEVAQILQMVLVLQEPAVPVGLELLLLDIVIIKDYYAKIQSN